MSMNMKRRARRRISARLARQQGMTLIEIMIVVMIMAMIATGVGVAVLPQFEKAKVKQAKTDIAAVRSAVTLYLMDESSGCPTVQELSEGKYLAKGKNTTDPWDHEYVITCQAGEDPEVYSTGPDGQEGTEDDVQ